MILPGVALCLLFFFLTICSVLNISDKVCIINWDGVPKLPQLKTLSRNSSFFISFHLNAKSHCSSVQIWRIFFRKIVMVVILASVRAFDLRQKAGITHLIQFSCYTASGLWPECASRAVERVWIIYLLVCLLVLLCAFLEHFNTALDMLEDKLALLAIILLEFLLAFC